MINTKQSGSSKTLALAGAIFAALAMGAAVALAPTNATPVAANSGAFGGPMSYLPHDIAGDYKPANVYEYE